MYKIFMENFISKYNVSRETFDVFSRYINILDEWRQRMNLVSPNSFNEIWTRHIADSYQLYKYLNADTKYVYDIGSGAGFPAIVLAIASQIDGRQTHFKLIESITKKTLYLNDVKEKLSLKNVEIINNRCENLKLKPADVITARAVAELNKLLSFAAPLSDMNTVLIFPKGKSFEQELIEAQKNWRFDVKIDSSEVSNDGVILKISNLRKKR